MAGGCLVILALDRTLQCGLGGEDIGTGKSLGRTSDALPRSRIRQAIRFYVTMITPDMPSPPAPPWGLQ
jgi:hypothetical protein